MRCPIKLAATALGGFEAPRGELAQKGWMASILWMPSTLFAHHVTSQEGQQGKMRKSAFSSGLKREGGLLFFRMAPLSSMMTLAQLQGLVLILGPPWILVSLFLSMSHSQAIEPT